MLQTKFCFLTASLLIAGSSFFAQAQPAPVVRVNVAQPIADIQPTMWGVFFEDINFGADGGIYAEMVKNRSFEFFKPLMGWKVDGKKRTEGDVLVQNRQDKQTSNPRYVRITTNNASQGDFSLTKRRVSGNGDQIGSALRFFNAVLCAVREYQTSR